MARSASVVASDRRTPSLPPTGPIGNGDTANEFRLKKKVLLADPELATLHRELVMTGQITELEFWEGRDHLLQAQAASEAQQKGRPGTMVDPRPETVDGEIKIVITPQLVHDIFEEYPVVARAYSENVPGQVRHSVHI
jgi:transcription initiation factor TFIIH subunit 1